MQLGKFCHPELASGSIHANEIPLTGQTNIDRFRVVARNDSGKGVNEVFTHPRAGEGVRRTGEGKKAAFTLAEVLITLGIIGVVAAMTIPNLIAKYTQKSFVIQWRKTYSSLAQAVRLMQENEDVISTAGSISQGDYEYELATLLGKHMKISKICHEGKGVEEGCFPERYKVYKNNNLIYSYSMEDIGGGSTCMSLLNGTLVCLDAYIVFVDVNGYKQPNTIGRDIYSALIDVNNYSINPAVGSRTGWGAADGIMIKPNNGDGTCKKTNTDNGWGCSKWYLHHMP